MAKAWQSQLPFGFGQQPLDEAWRRKAPSLIAAQLCRPKELEQDFVIILDTFSKPSTGYSLI